MKKLKVSILTMVTVILCFLSSTICLFAAEGDIAQAQKIKSDVTVSSSMDDSVIKVDIQNDSGETMKNVSLVFDSTNKLTADKTYRVLKDIESGDSAKVDFTVQDLGHGSVQSFLNSLGGYIPAVVLVGVVIIGILVAVILRKIFKIKGFNVELIVVCLTAVLLYSLLVINRPTYNVLSEGENYSRSIELTTEDNTEVVLLLKYNQDIVEETVTENEIYVPYETTFEYDESIPVTDEPKVKVEGVKGKKNVVTTCIYRNGKLADTVKEEEVLEEPVTEVKIQGTKEVISTETIEAEKTYVPDDTMKVGEYKLVTELSDSKENMGKKEITYNWDSKKNKITESEKVIKEPGVNTWKAGTLVEKVKIYKANTDYIAVEDKEVGYTNVLVETKDGNVTTTYKTEISTKTGKPVKNAELIYVGESKKAPVDGSVEVGVLKTQEIITTHTENITYDETKWDNYYEITKPGVDKKEVITSIMELDTKTGKVTNNVIKEVSRKISQEMEVAEVVRGSKSPLWVQEKKLLDQVQFNTVYKEDESGKLVGDEQEILQEGKFGRLYITQLIACDEEGNSLEGYNPQIVSKEELVKPEDKVVLVAKGSELLSKKD